MALHQIERSVRENVGNRTLEAAKARSAGDASSRRSNRSICTAARPGFGDDADVDARLMKSAAPGRDKPLRTTMRGVAPANDGEFHGPDSVQPAAR